MRPRNNQPRTRRTRRSRRGVSGVLAMMFMVMFGSLAAAMAIVSQGNLRTAQTHLNVGRALGAADTGVELARARLMRAASQLRVERGQIDSDFALRLWNGTWTSQDGQIVFPDGSAASTGLRGLLLILHTSDDYTTAIDPEYTPQASWLVTNPIVLDATAAGDPSTAVQITYAPLPDAGGVRAVVTGYSWDHMSNRWVSRTVQQDFRVFKRVDYAVLGASKIMIGKNVHVNGPLGARFTGVENWDGHPMIMRSDFHGLNPTLDAKLDAFYEKILTHDVDGDNRLRINHSIESQALSALNAMDFSGNGSPDNAFTDFTNNGFVDEFDIFLKHYDANGDGRVALKQEWRNGGPYEHLTTEFEGVDDNLAWMIDTAIPDRNGDGVVDHRDVQLGYRDGVLDYRDRYAKVRGTVTFRVGKDQWQEGYDRDGNLVENYQKFMKGAIRPDPENPPVIFHAGDELLPEIDHSTFQTADSALANAANGPPFTSQAGISSIWTPIVQDGVVVGQQINASLETVTEGVPFGAKSPADYYHRPVIRDKNFKNVVIPKGLNALFINCTFAGVTRVETHVDNTHPSWQFYGMQNNDLSLKFPPLPATSDAQLDNDYFNENILQPPDFDIPRLTVGGTPYVNTKPLSNNIRFHDCTFVGSIIADKPTNYTHLRNKLVFTGGTRFYEKHPDYPNDPNYNPNSSDLEEIAKSSMMLPHYSVDIGENNAPQSQDVNLKGLIIAGVLDVRGNATIDGALLTTFTPSHDDPALQHYGNPAGNPADFNITLGYFGPEDGDKEGLYPFQHNGETIVGFDTTGDGYVDTLDPDDGGTPVPFNGYGMINLNWDPYLVMPDGLIAPIQIEAVRSTYREGRIVQDDFQ